jgi:Phosphotransferase enzyme family
MRSKVDRRGEDLGARASALWAAVYPAGSPVVAVETLKPAHRKSAVVRLLGAGPDGQSIVAKRAARESIEIEARVYRDVLSQLSVSGTRLFGTATDDELSWLFLEDAGDAPFESGLDTHRCLAGVWMARVHGGAQLFPRVAELPARGPDHYRALLRTVERLLGETLKNPALASEEIAIVEDVVEACEALRSRWLGVAERLDQAPSTIAFGGFSSKNARVRETADGQVLMPFDFESAGYGCPAIDLVYPDGEAYVREARWWSGLDLDEFERMRGIGRLLGGLKAIPGERKVLLASEPSKAVAKLRWYGLEIEDGMRAAGLCDEASAAAGRLGSEA